MWKSHGFYSKCILQICEEDVLCSSYVEKDEEHIKQKYVCGWRGAS